jgi:hypothetical protein
MCPGRAAADLGAIAARFVPLENWLYSEEQPPGQPIVFSDAAVYTALRYFQTKHGPDDPNYHYGAQLNIARKDPDIKTLETIRAKVQQPGLHINDADIQRLQNITARRTEDAALFAARPEAERQRAVQQTRRFLERLALHQHERELLRDMPKELRAELPMQFNTPLTRAHTLDQLPHIVAGEALAACGGPMLLVKRRFLGFGAEQLDRICPYGPRNNDYERAAGQTYRAERKRPDQPI